MPSLTLTEKAAEKILEIRQAENLNGQGLRVRIVGGGCAGFSYDLFFDEQTTPMDKVIELQGVKLYVDPISLQYLDGTEIDYVEELRGAGFKFKNPQVKSTCGCGSSFQV